jgi:predicted RNA-binding Zn-ribbon protein involved in translation (DUF1610 family)
MSPKTARKPSQMSQMEEAEPVTVVATKARRCLSCEETFMSQWAGERVCPRCKQTSAWRGGLSYRRTDKDTP